MAKRVPGHAVTIQIGSDDSGTKDSRIEVPLIEGRGERLGRIDVWAHDVPIHLLNLSPLKDPLSFVV